MDKKSFSLIYIAGWIVLFLFSISFHNLNAGFSGDGDMATLEVIKMVINDDGGTATTSDFILKIDDWEVYSGDVNGLEPGDYTVSEENLDGYSATGWTGDCDSDGTITLEAGDAKGCFITNNDIADVEENEESGSGGFDNRPRYKVIDEELTFPINFTGTSTDSNEIESVDLIIQTLAGRGGVDAYPSKSFFNFFNAFTCPASLPLAVESATTTLANMSTSSTSWAGWWMPLEEGIFCVGLSITDSEGNISTSSFIGPIAYVPVAVISGESTSSLTNTSFTANWTTNKLATSRVIFDTVSHATTTATSTLGNQPNYGYASSTLMTDINPRVTAHSVLVKGLTVNITYYYRVVSSSSPESVGAEHSIKTTAPASGDSSGGSSGGGGGSSASFGGGGGPFFSTIPIGTPLTAPSLTSGGGGKVLGATGFVFKFDMKLGSTRQPDVTELQKRLQQEGFYKATTTTGHFGEYTMEALKAYQRKQGIPPTGFLSPLTRARLNGQVSSADNAARINALAEKVKELQGILDKWVASRAAGGVVVTALPTAITSAPDRATLLNEYGQKLQALQDELNRRTATISTATTTP